MRVKVSLPGRDEIELDIQIDANGHITQARLTGIGGPQLLYLLVETRKNLKGPLKKVPLPTGTDSSSILMREVLLRARGEWNPPYQELEICHCRAIPTAHVDMAIITGAHTPEEVSRQTSASTACGTCRPDVKDLIDYRLYSKTAKASSG